MFTIIRSAPSAAKACFAFLLAIALFVPTASAFASQESMQSWYSSTFAFNTNLRGATRTYDSSSVGIEFDTYQDSSYTSPVLTCALYRDGLLYDDYIGTASGKCKGSNHFDWTNVGSGDYYFYFSKTTDGYWVYSDYVKMFSW